VAINWCIAKGTIPIPGARSMAQVVDTLGAMGWSLSRAEVDELDDASQACKGAMVQNIFQTK
jgi:pyridoxine 4-dehydrogenase